MKEVVLTFDENDQRIDEIVLSFSGANRMLTVYTGYWYLIQGSLLKYLSSDSRRRESHDRYKISEVS